MYTRVHTRVYLSHHCHENMMNACELLLMRARARRAYCKKCRVHIALEIVGRPNIPVLIQNATIVRLSRLSHGDNRWQYLQYKYRLYREITYNMNNYHRLSVCHFASRVVGDNRILPYVRLCTTPPPTPPNARTKAPGFQVHPRARHCTQPG